MPNDANYYRDEGRLMSHRYDRDRFDMREDDDLGYRSRSGDYDEEYYPMGRRGGGNPNRYWDSESARAARGEDPSFYPYRARGYEDEGRYTGGMAGEGRFDREDRSFRPRNTFYGSNDQDRYYRTRSSRDFGEDDYYPRNRESSYGEMGGRRHDGDRYTSDRRNDRDSYGWGDSSRRRRGQDLEGDRWSNNRW